MRGKRVVAGIYCCGVETDSLAGGHGTLWQGVRGKVEDGMQALLEGSKGDGWLQVVEVHLL